MNQSTVTFPLQLNIGGQTVTVNIWMRITEDGVAQSLAAIQDSLRDLRPFYRKVANIMRRSFAENFRQGGRPEPWQALKPSTVFAKSRNPLSVYASARGKRRIRRLEQAIRPGGRMARSVHNILVIDGTYRDSWATKSRYHFENINKDGLEIGSKHWLAEIHEYGTGLFGPNHARYTIRPKAGHTALKWMSSNGTPVFARRIEHPGVPARPVGIIQEEDITAIAAALGEQFAD